MNTTARADVYRRIHRGLRKALFDLAYQAGRTTWTDAGDAARLQGLFLETMHFLKLHGEMEDTYHLPLLESKMPGITAHDRDEHETIEREIEDVEAALATAIIAAPDERRERGEAFLHQLLMFIASYLRHMSQEELVTTPLFHRYCTDAEIVDATRRLIAALEPADEALAMRYVIPALDAEDRIAYLRVLHASAPAASVAKIMAIAEETLGYEEWQRLSTALQPIAA